MLLNSANPDVGFSYFFIVKLRMPLFNAAGEEFTNNALIKE